MVRENGNCKDGEDERMLNGGGGGGDAEKEKLTQKEVEVKFVPEKNGDARIDMEVESEVCMNTKQSRSISTNRGANRDGVLLKRTVPWDGSGDKSNLCYGSMSCPRIAVVS